MLFEQKEPSGQKCIENLNYPIACVWFSFFFLVLCGEHVRAFCRFLLHLIALIQLCTQVLIFVFVCAMVCASRDPPTTSVELTLMSSIFVANVGWMRSDLYCQR